MVQFIREGKGGDNMMYLVHEAKLPIDKGGDPLLAYLKLCYHF